jgi:hypothetical protein
MGKSVRSGKGEISEFLGSVAREFGVSSWCSCTGQRQRTAVLCAGPFRAVGM